MNNLLSARLKRLEKSAEMGNPFAHLTDEELDARIKEVTDEIESSVGMPIADYADALCRMSDEGEALPNGMTPESVRDFAATIRRTAANGR